MCVRTIATERKRRWASATSDTSALIAAEPPDRSFSASRTRSADRYALGFAVTPHSHSSVDSAVQAASGEPERAACTGAAQENTR